MWDAKHTHKAAALKLKGIWTALVTANFEARITVAQLLKGASFSAHDVVELWATENGIKAGVNVLEAKIGRLRKFDERFEDVREPEDHDDGIPPADWGRARRS